MINDPTKILEDALITEREASNMYVDVNDINGLLRVIREGGSIDISNLSGKASEPDSAAGRKPASTASLEALRETEK